MDAFFDESDEDDDIEEVIDLVSEEGGACCLEIRQSSMTVRLPRPKPNDALCEDIDAIINRDMDEIEAKHPWKFVFRCAAVPFHFKRSEDQFDVFFLRWDKFWTKHGHAVWERYFWRPLAAGSLEANRRKNRQERAAKAFRCFAQDLYDRKGDAFVASLVKKPRDGWWYRTKVVSLRKLFRYDRDQYRRYMNGHRLRWPCGKRPALRKMADWCIFRRPQEK
ncbi:TPA: hypothetical protein N0F65_010245 [Lagenidium giganteum]|uniref:Uncharacterized protein n=1 Tax=Lagenidium giganteum TaxID=4803 RepID=A0AAV2Z024_9STRA|nr:TPA: hypothetical protein N0F65_010245 [Lagenidium giganteum]